MRISDWSSDVCSSDLCDPQAQDVRAQRLHDVLRLDAVAQRLGHLAAVLVDGEPVRQALPVRRCPVDRDAGEQRRLEPAAVLVRTFQVQVRSEEHTSELQSLMRHSYAAFCLEKTTNNNSSNQISYKY